MFHCCEINVAGLPAFDASSIASAQQRPTPSLERVHAPSTQRIGVMFYNATAAAPTCTATTARTVTGTVLTKETVTETELNLRGDPYRPCSFLTRRNSVLGNPLNCFSHKERSKTRTDL